MGNKKINTLRRLQYPKSHDNRKDSQEKEKYNSLLFYVKKQVLSLLFIEFALQ